MGSLFQQNTKAKDVNDLEYAQTCFHYIHQNPLKSKLVKKMEDWPHHSFNEYWKGEKGICNVALAIELLAIPTTQDQFYRESYNVVTGDYSLPWLSGSTTSSGGTTSITK